MEKPLVPFGRSIGRKAQLLDEVGCAAMPLLFELGLILQVAAA